MNLFTETENGFRMSRPMNWLYDRTSTVDQNGVEWGWPWHEDIRWVASRTVALATFLTLITASQRGFSWGMAASALGLSLVLVLVYHQIQCPTLHTMFLDVVFGGDRRVVNVEWRDGEPWA